MEGAGGRGKERKGEGGRRRSSEREGSRGGEGQ